MVIDILPFEFSCLYILECFLLFFSDLYSDIAKVRHFHIRNIDAELRIDYRPNFGIETPETARSIVFSTLMNAPFSEKVKRTSYNHYFSILSFLDILAESGIAH